MAGSVGCHNWGSSLAPGALLVHTCELTALNAPTPSITPTLESMVCCPTYR